MGKSSTSKKGKGNLSRKDLRKVSKENERLKKQIHHLKHKTTAGKATSQPETIDKSKNSKTIEPAKQQDKPKSVLSKKQKLSFKDPAIEAEDAEIARLGKLLGIEKGKSKKSVSDKLNKEFELYEGIGGGFGDFLNDLDDLTDMIENDEDDNEGTDKKKKKRKRIFYDENDEGGDENDVEEVHMPSGGHIIDDDEQEQSDIDDGTGDYSDDDYYSSEEMEESEGEGEDDNDDNDDEDDNNQSEGSDNSEGDDDGESQSQQSDEVEEEEDGEDGEDNSSSDRDNSDDEEEDDEEGDKKESNLLFTYKPVAGEDIYGRKLDVDPSADSAMTKKYVPPGKRKEVLSKIDETSESVRNVRREINGLMNKLSDSSKDSIVRSIKNVFNANSTSVCSLVLKDCIMAACANPTQLMTTLIPIYAAIVAALHFSIGADVGAFIIESLTLSLHTAISSATQNNTTSHDLISSKLPNNALLLLVYLYNLRVLHHTLIIDIMNALADITGGQQSTAISAQYMELRIELLECLINHCGVSIRSDDPVSLKNVINVLSKTLKDITEQQEKAELEALKKKEKTAKENRLKNVSNSENNNQIFVQENSRLRFMFEALTDLKNNKSRRIQTVNADIVKGLRKWLGSIKNTLGTKSGDLCLRVSLRDLLDAEQRGRWWKAGASWTGKDKSTTDTETAAQSKRELAAQNAANKPKVVNQEEEMLLKLATKLKMNTSIRRAIFVVLMSSRDIIDAFERLTKLELKGKQDREIVLVIIECCGQEKLYNPFYYELGKMLCSANRQYKTTFQFAIWDYLKTIAIDDKEGKVNTRRIVNIARLLAQLICSFHLPLTVIKTIDMSQLNDKLVLFLSTFFMALFKENITDDEFQSVVDRVATTKDFAIVRDNILFFLRRYLETFPSGLDPTEHKKMNRRRKNTLKTMEAMTVLDISRGMMDEDEDMSMLDKY